MRPPQGTVSFFTLWSHNCLADAPREIQEQTCNQPSKNRLFPALFPLKKKRERENSFFSRSLLPRPAPGIRSLEDRRDGPPCTGSSHAPRGVRRPPRVLKDPCRCRSQSISNPHVRNFGRSLLAGYCPTYMPDLALHGTGSDERLKQCLTADLLHTVRVSDPRRGPRLLTASRPGPWPATGAQTVLPWREHGEGILYRGAGRVAETNRG